MCGVLGLNTDVSLIYQLFAFLLCLTIFSRQLLRLHKPSISVTRKLPKYASAGETFSYRIKVTNTGSRVEADLLVVDNPIVVPPSREQFKKHAEPGEYSRNAWDRFIGFHRFIYLQGFYTGMVSKTESVPDIPLKASVDVNMQTEIRRRGMIRLASISILHPDPLNLNHGVTTFDSPASLIALPKRYKIPKAFKLEAGRHFQPGGISATWSIGESDEFVSLRDYRDGDSMRNIHWASTAKRNKPVVKEYQDEYFVRQALILDTSTEDDDLLEESISVAASFVLSMDKADSVLDLIYLSHKPELLTSGRGTNSVNTQLEALAMLKPSELALNKLTEATINHARLISACILVLSDWTQAQEELVESLESLGIPLKIFIICKDESKLAELLIPWKILPIGEIQKRLDQI